MKHLDVTVKAPKVTTIPLPAWYGRAAAAIRVLADNPDALSGVGTLDIDAVHRSQQT